MKRCRTRRVQHLIWSPTSQWRTPGSFGSAACWDGDPFETVNHQSSGIVLIWINVVAALDDQSAIVTDLGRIAVLRVQQNEFITRTGPGTPMGELFRRYWTPALLAEELPENDCPPVRVKLLSERLLAFRDSRGRYGLVDEFCAHRGVSLWFGRNEDCGLRCPYHGWKFDVTGQCTEVPSEPAGSEFSRRIKLKSYPLIERGGILWAYLGPPDSQPPQPEWEFVTVP